MNANVRRFAPLGLILALVSGLAAVGIYIVMRAWNLPLQISVGLFVIGLALFALLDPGRVRSLLTGRQARYGSNALVLALAFIGIVVVLNYLVYQNSKRWDLTENKKYTLAPETLDALAKLPNPVQAQAFFSPQVSSTTTEDAKKLLDQYAFNSKGKFKYEFIDPYQNPVAAQQAKIDRDGMIVLSMGTQQEPVQYVTEEELTSSMLRLMNPETRNIYFLTGHGERSPEDITETAYSQAKQVLESKNYAVKTLALAVENKVPDDARVIVVAGPRTPLAQNEVDLLSGFLEKGGAVVVMEEPLPLTDFGDGADPVADLLNSQWGITLGKDMVVDLTSSNPVVAISADYGNHPVTEKINTYYTVFPTARSVTAATAVQGVTEVQLVLTSKNSWAETDLAALASQNQQVGFDAGTDKQGPVSLVVAAENTTTKGRVVVFGDVDFASNSFYRQDKNGDFFTNSIDWAAGQENLINLTPKQEQSRTIVPPTKYAMNLILLGSVIVLPGLALVSGVWVWVQRSKRG